MIEAVHLPANLSNRDTNYIGRKSGKNRVTWIILFLNKHNWLLHLHGLKMPAPKKTSFYLFYFSQSIQKLAH
jgi:hypothetical protein